jgi:hypothetical protein
MIAKSGKQKWVMIKRTPVLTLWAAVVGETTDTFLREFKRYLESKFVDVLDKVYDAMIGLVKSLILSEIAQKSYPRY